MIRPRTVLITGATGGIGAALAQAYAAPDRVLILHGRDPDRLAKVVAQCEARGSHVTGNIQDIRDTDAWMDWLRQVSHACAIDLLIVNAGINIDAGENRRGETWADTRRLLDTNITAALATVHAVLPAMRARGSGQIALLSSLAGYRGLPITPAYSASKAAIKAYGEGLREWLKADGVGVSVIMPGYVDSGMCRAMAGPKPFLWSADKAASAIKKGLHNDRARISFPFPLAFSCWLLAALPSPLSGWLLRRLGYGG